ASGAHDIITSNGATKFPNAIGTSVYGMEGRPIDRHYRSAYNEGVLIYPLAKLITVGAREQERDRISYRRPGLAASF
ncbi:MAG TPA: hypothetical protein PLJ24_03720, partial [Anaerolineae bacterium]|nr:hypothetical protein [Anaerolineae bacterium]